jgi:plasmid rolling circle replication initiator protein Rep
MTKTEVQAGKRLVDKSASGHVRPWDKHKEQGMILSMAYDELDESKAARLRECASVLIFKPSEGGGIKLDKANFCRVRLCPMCTWRRSLKLQAQMTKTMDAMKAANEPVKWIYLTLTVRNVEGEELRDELDAMDAAWQRLTQLREFRNAVVGYMRSVEVTHNVTPGDPAYDTYHPHTHALLAVNPEYFTGRSYMPHARWMELWRQSARLNYDPRVRIQRVKGNTAKAVADAAGYSAKAQEYIIPEDWDLTVESVRILDAALADRRLVTFGGIVRAYRKKLNQQEPDEGDLIHIDEDEPTDSKEERRIKYAWFSGFRQYREVENI